MYTPTFKTNISDNKEDALQLANNNFNLSDYRVYSDGSGHGGGIGAAAVLYNNSVVIQKLQFHLGPDTMHTVYKAELVGIILALFLLTHILRAILTTIIIGLDNQAVIQALNSQLAKPSHYLLDLIHNSAKRLHQKQDKLCNPQIFQTTPDRPTTRTPKKRKVCDLHIHWVPGHSKFAPNKLADELAKEAADGISSPS